MAATAGFISVQTPAREHSDITRARELVLSFGWNSTSFQIINPGIRRWFSAAADAVVGYVSSAGVRVAVGAPVCEWDRVEAVAEEFENDARRCQEGVCYFGAEQRLESVYAGSGDHT